MAKYAILIDAGFLKPKLGTTQDPADADCLVEFSNKLQQTELLKDKDLYRIYYYDAPPMETPHNKPLNGG